METVKNSGKSSENRGYDLKPCPFCSCHAGPRRELFAGELECFYVSCGICGARGQICNTKEDAIRKWNTRKKPYESRKKLPCPKCGTPRPETWFSSSMLEDKKVGIKCRECGFAVWDKSEIQAIREWNSEKRGTDG